MMGMAYNSKFVLTCVTAHDHWNILHTQSSYIFPVRELLVVPTCLSNRSIVRIVFLNTKFSLTSGNISRSFPGDIWFLETDAVLIEVHHNILECLS